MSNPYQEWVWSPEGQDFYMYTWNREAQEYTAQWSKKRDSAAEIVTPHLHSGQGKGPGQAYVQTYPLSSNAGDVPTNETGGNSGWENQEPLDPQAPVRRDYSKSFFSKGRVLSVPFIQPPEYLGYVVVRELKDVSYACPISTYGGQGTSRQDLDPRTHAIIYTHGTQWSYVDGEEELEKVPIPVIPATDTPNFTHDARINFAQHVPIQHSCKVTDLGCVRHDYIRTVVEYAKEEFNSR